MLNLILKVLYQRCFLFLVLWHFSQKGQHCPPLFSRRFPFNHPILEEPSMRAQFTQHNSEWRSPKGQVSPGLGWLYDLLPRMNVIVPSQQLYWILVQKINGPCFPHCSA